MYRPASRKALQDVLIAGVIGVLAGRITLAVTPTQAPDPETLASQVRTLKEYRDCRGALKVGTTLLQGFPQSDAARKIDRLLDQCLAELTWKEIEEIADQAPSPRMASKALLALGRRQANNDDCPSAIKTFDRVTVIAPDATEAWRAAIDKAQLCLEPMGRHDAAISTLEEVVDRAGHTPEAAFALYILEFLHRDHEERDEARAAIDRLIRDYPSDLEYPSSPGLKIVQFAQRDLKYLDRYFLSPTLDKFISWLRRAWGLDRSSWRTWSNWLSLSLTSLVTYGVQIAALLLVLSMLAIARLVGLFRPSSGVWIFARIWTLRRACGLLLVLWSIELIYELIFHLDGTFDFPDAVGTFLWVYGEKFITLITAGTALVICLRKESIRRVFAIGRRSLMVVGGGLGLLVAFYVLTSALRDLILWACGQSAEPVLYREFLYGNLSTARAAIVTIAVTVLAAAAEEVVFRGVLYETFTRLSRRWVAAILCSILFGAAHVVPLAEFATLTLMGLLLVYVRDRSGGLLAPLVLHALNNVLVDLVHPHHR